MSTAEAGLHLFEGKLHRTRRSYGTAFVEGPVQPPTEPVRRPARIAVMLALAHKIQQAVDRGVVRDRAEVARRLGLTRARVTQLLDLTLLAPDLQEQALDLIAVNGVEPICEPSMRAVLAACSWAEQRARYRRFAYPD
jgi:hypothetical protein